MMKLIKVLRAKSKDDENYLLIDHIKETILQARRFREFVTINKEAIQYSRLINNDSFFKDLIVACFLHDLGKINCNFQKKVFKKEEKNEDNEEWQQIKSLFAGYENLDIKDHEAVSILYSYIFLGNEESEKKIRTAILLHHYNNFYVNREANIRYIFDDYPDLEKYIDLLEKKEVKELLEDLLDFCIENLRDDVIKKTLKELKDNLKFDRLRSLKECLAEGYGLSTKIKFYGIPDKEDNNKGWLDFFVFLGALRRCDYAASGGVEIEETEKAIREIYKELPEKIKKCIERRELWQEEILEKNDKDNLILVAPTGSGKTEFALLWAKNRKKKLIYTLPLRVALNDLFGRFRESEKNEGYFSESGENDLVDILHSTSFMEYLKEEREGKNIDISLQQTSAKLFSSPILLTTPDQVFLSSLKYYGFDKLLSVYPLSSVVIDEIQAYNPEMAAVVIKTLEIIKELCGSVLIITATFPPYFRKFLENGLKFKTIKIEDLINRGEIKEDEIKNYKTKRHKIDLINKQIFEYKEKKDREKLELILKEDSFEEIKNKIKERKGENILIILNTVGKAIELYKKLEEISGELEIKKENLYLLHSRLIEKEKGRRIREIKEKLENREKGLVLVATQIVEASVDVDFDLLITEISPIDSQIQRWGRVWRNRNSEEEELNYESDKPNVYIFTGIDRGTSAIYNGQSLQKTIEVLKDRESELKKNVLDYKSERELIDSVYSDELMRYYEKEISKNLEWLDYYSAEKRSEAQKIFRSIAGIQVFVPNLPDEENEIYKALCEILNEDKDNWNMPLETSDENKDSIVKKIEDKTGKAVNKWEILNVLYNYSFSLPIFGYEKIRFENLKRNSFKGFFILKEDKKENLTEIKIYGINKIKENTLDQIEINESENIQNNIIH